LCPDVLQGPPDPPGGRCKTSGHKFAQTCVRIFYNPWWTLRFSLGSNRMMRGSSPRARAQDVRDTTHDTRHARQDAGAHNSTGWSHWAWRSVSQPLGSESCSFLLILVTHLGQLQSPAGMALSGGSRQWRCQPRSHESHRSILSGLSPCLHLWQISAPTSESSSSSFPVACSHSRHRHASSCQVAAGAHVE